MDLLRVLEEFTLQHNSLSPSRHFEANVTRTLVSDLLFMCGGKWGSDTQHPRRSDRRRDDVWLLLLWRASARDCKMSNFVRCNYFFVTAACFAHVSFSFFAFISFAFFFSFSSTIRVYFEGNRVIIWFLHFLQGAPTPHRKDIFPLSLFSLSRIKLASHRWPQ